MNRIFVIADLHFSHEKVSKLRGFSSVEEHDKALVESWNETVYKKDVVYILGDLFKIDLISSLNGTKKLALGNHDTKPMGAYSHLFSKINAYFEYNGCLLSHIPVHESQFSRWNLNIHGHTHARTLVDPRYICVSVEQSPNLAPMLINDLIHNRYTILNKEKNKLYDKLYN